MAQRFLLDVDLTKNSLFNFRAHPIDLVDVASPEEGQIWYRTDTDQLRIQTNGSVETIAFMSDVTASGISGNDYNAQSLLLATTDNTPVAVTVPLNSFVGRAGENIGVLNADTARGILNVEDGATADQTASEILSLLLTVDGAGSGLDADTLDGAQLTTLATQADIANLATETYADTAAANAVAALVDGAPTALDTLNELAAAINDNANYASAIQTQLAARTEKYAEDIGDGSTTAIAVTHSLGTSDFTWSIREVSSGEHVSCLCTVNNSNTATFTFATAPATDALRVVIIG